MADILNEIVEGSIVKIAQESINDNNLYQFEDYPVGGITNEQMSNALTSSQSGFYQTNSVYMCIDGGTGKTYLKNHFYRFNLTSWEDVTPEFAGEIKEKTLEELETETIDDNTLYAIDDYPLGGITQAQMTNALKITQRGFYKVNSVYLCVDGDETSTYVKNHFYRFSYDETTDTYSWVDTKAGADVDNELSLESENPVQNKVITENLNNKVSKTGDENIYGIKSFDVRPKLGIGATLPNEYQEVEYVELTGSQYINTTEQIWNTSKYTNWKIDFDFTPTAAYDYNAIFGTASGATTFESWIASDKNFYFRYNNNKQTVANITPNTRYKFIADYTPSTLTFTINGTSKSISQSAGSIASDLYIGRRDANYGKFKIYSLKLYGNDNLIKQFIPCYRKSDEVIGLYDTVSSTFFTNSGTGVFLKGENVYRGVDFATIEDVSIAKQELQTQIDDKVSLTKNELISGQKTFKVRPQIGEVRLPSEYTEVEYIESTGTQYIDTGVKFGTGFACDIKFNMLSTSGDIDMLSSGVDENYLLVSYLNGTPCIYLNGSASKNITMPYNTVHTVNMNYNGTTLTYKVDDTTTYTLSASNLAAESNLLLFARKPSYGLSKAILYYCKIYNNDTLIHDFIPCYTNQQVTNNNVAYEVNTIGLYDTVNNIFYVNNGTGIFTKGQNILAGEYIALQSELPIANPTTTTETPNLTSISINGIDYKIAGGSGGDYTAGNGINITDNTISADTNVLAIKDDIPTGEVDVTFNGTATETMEALNNVVIGDTTYTISEPHNPNLLLNDEMKINQRDKSVYYGENAYGTDRWLCVDESAFMRLNSSSQWVIGLEDTESAGERIAIKQIIEDYQSLKGQTVTLTLNYSDLTEGVSGTTQLSLYDGVKTEIVTLTSSGTAILTTTISSNADRVEVRIKTSVTGTDTSLVFKYCKLELGSSSTPLVQKNTGLALTECQRYYQKLSTFGCSNIPTSETSFDAPINLLTSLRTTPTLKLSANPLIVGNGNSISSTSYSISSLKNNKVIINLQSTQSITLNQVYVLSDVTAELDAEMY